MKISDCWFDAGEFIDVVDVFVATCGLQNCIDVRPRPHKSQKWIYKIKTLLIEQFIVSNLMFNVSQIHLIDLGVTLNVIYNKFS